MSIQENKKEISLRQMFTDLADLSRKIKSRRKHKTEILAGDGRNIMDIFADEMTPMVERLIWKAYQSGDSAEIGRTISNYMDGLVFSVAADLQDIEDRFNQEKQERRA